MIGSDEYSGLNSKKPRVMTVWLMSINQCQKVFPLDYHRISKNTVIAWCGANV